VVPVKQPSRSMVIRRPSLDRARLYRAAASWGRRLGLPQAIYRMADAPRFIRNPGRAKNLRELSPGAVPYPVKRKPGMLDCQLVFEEVHGTPAKGYEERGRFAVQGRRRFRRDEPFHALRPDSRLRVCKSLSRLDRVRAWYKYRCTCCRGKELRRASPFFPKRVPGGPNG
jgi:hypothetical protein